ncbi:SRPBCC family protein [Reichenbachiella sp.]|uniref:SRPBCC family protein n=1 Tax=Reichenbachiella sp. TaxID=2184521 RepID=UPI003B5BFB7E
MKKSSFKVEQIINASPNQAWEVIGAVSGVEKWLGPITACRIDGGKRFCTTEDGTFEEDILKVDHHSKVLEYAIPSQHMIPVENIFGTMEVSQASDGKALITWHWNFEVLPENEEVAKNTFEMLGGMGLSGIDSLINQKAA